jgi:hypothetical protein
MADSRRLPSENGTGLSAWLSGKMAQRKHSQFIGISDAFLDEVEKHVCNSNSKALWIGVPVRLARNQCIPDVAEGTLNSLNRVLVSRGVSRAHDPLLPYAEAFILSAIRTRDWFRCEKACL